MLGILLLLQGAALGSAPQGIPGQWVTVNDYPAEALHQKWEGPVESDISIDTTGRITACGIVVSTGHQILDETSCRLIMLRGRYRPARDEAGQPVASGAHVRFSWILPGGRASPLPRVRQPDLILEIQKVPGQAETSEVVLRIVREADGTQVSCEVAEPSPSTAINAAACKVAAPLVKGRPVLDSTGTPVRNLRIWHILFKQA